MKNNKHLIIWNLLLLLYLAAVAYLCFSRIGSSESLPKEMFGIQFDKVAHFLMFLPLIPLVYLAMGMRSIHWWHAILLTLVLICAGLGLAWLTEEVQGLIPYRTKDPADLKADHYALMAGALIELIMDLSLMASSRRSR